MPWALCFNGTQASTSAQADRVDFGAQSGIQLDAFTIEVDVHPYELQALAGIMCHGKHGTGDTRWHLSTDAVGTGVRWFFANSNGTDSAANYVTLASCLTLDTRARLHLRYNAGIASILVNGAGSSVVTGSIPVTLKATIVQTFKLGVAEGILPDTLAMRIGGGVRVWSRSLSDAECVQRAADTEVTAGLIRHWPFSEGGGETVHDRVTGLAANQGVTLPTGTGPGWVERGWVAPTSGNGNAAYIHREGDSNTEGTGSAGADRVEIQSQLNAAGWYYDMRGTRTTSSVAYSGFDAHHKGTAGARVGGASPNLTSECAAEMTAEMNDSYAGKRIKINTGGTNDIGGGSYGGADTPVAASVVHSRYVTWITTEETTEPGAVFVCDTIPDWVNAAAHPSGGTYGSQVDDFQSGFVANVLTPLQATYGSTRIVRPEKFVHECTSTADLQPDGVHLSRAGHEKAAYWRRKAAESVLLRNVYGGGATGVYEDGGSATGEM